MTEKSTLSPTVLRILDAAANRAGEGLRVAEDYSRFALDDRHLTERCKQARHDLANALRQIPALDRHFARDTLGDVGTTLSTSGERTRVDAVDVALASLKRAEQALRSLEEYGKLVAGDFCLRCEAIRYTTYTLERAIHTTQASAARLAAARLYVLVDGGGSGEKFSALVDTLVAAEVDVIQLRDKQLDDRQLFDRAQRLIAATRDAATLAIINDRADLAVVAGANGVHVGEEDFTVQQARSVVGADRLVGVSTHSIEQARAGILAGANYLGVGPTFASQTKTFDSLAGLDFVRQVAAEITLPVFALGGITLDNVTQVRDAGLNRVAVARAVTAAADPAAAVCELRRLLQ